MVLLSLATAIAKEPLNATSELSLINLLSEAEQAHAKPQGGS
jgi:hypothetical protein